jgi:fibronectin type 3 domain-containing protein
LEAVFSGPGQKPFIDLVWAPNSEPDLAGYNLYRAETGSEPQRVNQEPLKSPAYRDGNVTPGRQYTYAVAAVDVRGNESAHSEAASETVPPQ